MYKNIYEQVYKNFKYLEYFSVDLLNVWIGLIEMEHKSIKPRL